jgi:hypothetical protein
MQSNLRLAGSSRYEMCTYLGTERVMIITYPTSRCSNMVAGLCSLGILMRT